MIVVPDGILYFLPFDTLRDPNGSFLAESRTISYVPAMTVLDVLRTRSDPSKPRHSFLGVGDVPYRDQGDVSPELPKPKGIEKTVLRGFSDTLGTPLHDLPQTRAEVLDANKILGNDGVILLGSHATEAAFESEPLADHRRDCRSRLGRSSKPIRYTEHSARCGREHRPDLAAHPRQVPEHFAD